MRHTCLFVLIAGTACAFNTAPALSGETAAAVEAPPVASDPIVAPVKRAPPQMPANADPQPASVAPAKKPAKAAGKKAR